MTLTNACPDAVHLTALLDGTLSAAEAAGLNTHLEQCPTCQQALEGLVAGKESWSNVARHLDHGGDVPDAAPEGLLHQVGVTYTAVADPGATTPPHAPGIDDLPTRFGHYQIQEVIGKGGMGLVLKAFDEKLHRVVAIKVMTAELAASAAARQRFAREAKSAAAVSHEHVVTIHAVEAEHRPPYIVMQYVGGVSLQDRIDGTGPLQVKEILRIGMQAAAGLAAAHAQGIIHRDVKPANILLENGIERVKITDFGLARTIDDASVTQSGVIAGTPMYMAPEQAAGEAVDHRADLFSLGSVLYATCTGRPPFRASGTMGVLKRVIEDVPRPIREINPDIPAWLGAIIEKLHAKQADDRFHSAEEVATLFEACLAHVQQPQRVPLPAGIPKSAAPDLTTQEAPTPVTEPAAHVVRGALTVAGIGVAVQLVILTFLVSRGQQVQLALIGSAVGLGLVGLAWLVRGRRKRQTGRRARTWALALVLLPTLLGGGGYLAATYVWPADAYLHLTWDDPELLVTLEGKGGTYFSDWETGIGTPIRPGTYTVRAFKKTHCVHTEEFMLAASEARQIVIPEWGTLAVEVYDPDIRVTLNEAEPVWDGVLCERRELGVGSEWLTKRLPKGPYTLQATRYGQVVLVSGVRIHGGAIAKVPIEPSRGGRTTAAGRWVPLFNGADLTGWQMDPDHPASWNVIDGSLVGNGLQSYLFSQRDDYRDFHLRFEAKIEGPRRNGLQMDGGVLVQAPFLLRPADGGLFGYGVAISCCQPGTVHAGNEWRGQPAWGWLFDTWLAGEVIATGNRFVVKINGITTADFRDPKHRRGNGRLALGVEVGQTKVHFRKIELRALPPTDTAWKVIAAKFDGNELAADEVKDWRVAANEDCYRHVGFPEPQKGTFRLDATKTQGTVDYTVMLGPHEGRTIIGIYSWDGRTLRICTGPPGTTDRPTDFTSPPGSGRWLLAMQESPFEKDLGVREATAEMTRAAMEQSKFQGRWVIVSAEAKGRPLTSEQRAQKCPDVFTFAANRWSDIVGDEQQKGHFCTDPAHSPKRISMAPSGPSSKGTGWHGVYEIDGDTLKVCLASGGEPQPKNFATDWRDDRFLAFYQRQPESKKPGGELK